MSYLTTSEGAPPPNIPDAPQRGPKARWQPDVIRSGEAPQPPPKESAALSIAEVSTVAPEDVIRLAVVAWRKALVAVSYLWPGPTLI